MQPASSETNRFAVLRRRWRRSLRALVGVFSVALGLSGCCTSAGGQCIEDPGDGPTADGGTGPTLAPEDVAALARVANGSYRNSIGFRLINEEPYRSEVARTSYINVFISIGGASSYSAIAPELVGTDAPVPEGTMIVREVLDRFGEPEKLTLMAKAGPGYNPPIGDWWWAVTDPDGNPLPDSYGNPQAGQMPECHSCHVPRRTDDYLFGVPAAVRGPLSPLEEDRSR